MKVAVTGSTGFVGRHVCAELVERGISVRALIRDREKAAGTLPGEGVTPIVGDACDAQALRDLVRGCRAVIHCIGIRREAGPAVTFERLHIESVRKVVEAAREAGVRRLVLVSALGVGPGATTEYGRTKHAGEQIVRTSGLEWTILRPSIIHGPDGELVQLIKGWVLGRETPRAFMPWFARVEKPTGLGPPKLVSAKVQPVSVDDVAWAACESLERPEAAGEVFELGGPSELTWPELYTAVRDAMPMTDSKKKPVPIPGPMGVAMARGAKAVGLAQLLPFGPDEPALAQQDVTCSNDKAERLLGFEPVAFDAALLEYAGRI